MKTEPLPEGFAPYEDRTARDIRNAFSRAFVRAVERGAPDPFESEAEKWLNTDPPKPCRRFIRDRLSRYEAVLAEIERERIADPLRRAAVIWNHGLFFEVHEQIEAFWRKSTGDRRKALQGWILAAGVYVHLEAGNRPAAQKLAEKAGRLLAAHGGELPEIANLKTLLERIQALDREPPRLELTLET